MKYGWARTALSQLGLKINKPSKKERTEWDNLSDQEKTSRRKTLADKLDGAYGRMIFQGFLFTRNDLLTADRCFEPGTIISGDYKAIEDYRAGDSVLGVDGLDRVERTGSRHYEGDLLEVNTTGVIPFKVTPDHLIYVVSRSPRRGNWTTHYGSEYRACWKRADQLVPVRKLKGGDYLVLPRLEGTETSDRIRISEDATIPLDWKTAWLLGMYVAEGCFATGTRSTRSIFSLGAHEKKLIKRLCDVIKSLGWKPYVAPVKNGGRCVFLFSTPFSRFLRDVCGSGAKTKRIPEFILNHKNKAILGSFLEGYMAGDGCTITTESGTRCEVGTTASKVLALQLQLLSATLGNPFKINVKPPRICWINGKRANSGVWYQLRRIEPRSKERNRMMVLSDKVLLPIRYTRVSSHYVGDVWNLQTQHKVYLANNVLVHNSDLSGTVIMTLEAYHDLFGFDGLGELGGYTDKNLYAESAEYLEDLSYLQRAKKDLERDAGWRTIPSHIRHLSRLYVKYGARVGRRIVDRVELEQIILHLAMAISPKIINSIGTMMTLSSGRSGPFLDGMGRMQIARFNPKAYVDERP